MPSRPGLAPHATRPRHPRGGLPIGGLALLLVIVIIAIAISMNVGGNKSYVENVAEARRSGQQMDVTLDTRSIVQMVTAYQLENDRYPASFADLGQTPPRDPWGSELTFTIDTTVRPAALVVTSPGPDTQPGNEDDIIRRETLPV